MFITIPHLRRGDSLFKTPEFEVIKKDPAMNQSLFRSSLLLAKTEGVGTAVLFKDSHMSLYRVRVNKILLMGRTSK